MKRLVKKIVCWWQNFIIKRTDAVVLIGLILIFISVFSYPNIAVQAATLTPEATEYNVPNPDSRINLDNNNPIENIQQNLKYAADNVREKLNLDEPLPESTKDFLQSTEQKIDETVEPITGKQKYYDHN
ncbi:hypothetical protein IQ247_25185 [Plectonema cf. radiosum LEGE 06105]|uniref:Uncharacterized protein n=1 Tax=Plectonema cf. radiosum LEGE 06105 TaxID=945769 RepID=A0A8J7F3Z4_9CYAN|nr:hypothetical protein [Plectonema radiosum]MBE9215916.1 hypothetical protein [Plectonema cf. radiosum LEGE 06105]